jgi:hypothetical protein
MSLAVLRNQIHRNELLSAEQAWSAVYASRARATASRVVTQPSPKIEPIRQPARMEPAMGEVIDLPQFLPQRGVEPVKITIKAVQEAVCRRTQVRRNDLLSSRRDAAVILPRHIAMALTKYLTTKSLPEIGRQFGGKDHTTVLHACRKMEAVIHAVALELGPSASLDDWVLAVLDLAKTTPLRNPDKRWNYVPKNTEKTP